MIIVTHTSLNDGTCFTSEVKDGELDITNKDTVIEYIKLVHMLTDNEIDSITILDDCQNINNHYYLNSNE